MVEIPRGCLGYIEPRPGPSTSATAAGSSRWSESVIDSDRHRAAVGDTPEQALKTRSSISSPGSFRDEGVHQILDVALANALTVVFRILFLLFTEARGLVPQSESRLSEQLHDSSRCGPRLSAAVGPQGRGRQSWPSLASRIFSAWGARSRSRALTAGCSPLPRRYRRSRNRSRIDDLSDTRCPVGHHHKGWMGSTRSE